MTEYWEMCFEHAIEDLANQFDIDYEPAQEILEKVLEHNTRYLDGYVTFEGEI